MWNFTSVRLRVRVFAVLLAALILLPFATGGAAAATTITVTGQYYQTDARSMLNMINKFRQGDNAWYWNSNDSEKIWLNGLKPYTYDYNLEKIAMQRAMEIALLFAHERPDGSSIYSISAGGITSCGENIAIGTGNNTSTAEKAFNQWLEENDKYEGQGHRRSMLSDSFSCVGIAHVKVGNVHCYVQEFGKTNSGGSDPGASNGVETRQVPVVESQLTASVRFNSPSADLYCGTQITLPSVSLGLRIPGTWGPSNGVEVGASEYSVSWSSDDSNVAQVSEGVIIGVGDGQANIIATITYKGTTAVGKYPVKVHLIDLGSLNFGNVPDQKYTGSPITIAVDIKVNDIGLTEGKDYTISYENNIGPGTASFTIKGKGWYTGSKTVTFKIVSDGSQAPQPTKIPTTPPTGTPTPTKEPTKVPTATNTPVPTKTPTKAPTKAPTATPSSKPAKTPTPKPTNTPIPKATNTPIPTVTPVPTEEPSPTPEATPTEEPVPTEELTPTPAEELTPTGELTPTPAEEITPTAGPTPTEGVPGIPSPDGPEDNPPGEVSNPPSGETPGEYDQTLLLPPENSVADKGGAEAEITEDSAGGSSGGKPEFVWLYALIPAALIGAVITGTVLVLRKRG